MSKKKEYGQFFTSRNPFLTEIFKKWIQEIEKNIKPFNEISVVEPFAGGRDLIKHVKEAGYTPAWTCYDIDPIQKDIIKQDTIDKFPENFLVAITNPPYLAKVSATRQKLKYPIIAKKYPDIYLFALEKMLLHCDYVLAIIPESFITKNLFKNRLMAVDSRCTKIFDDTEIPVCVAYFIPGNKYNDFEIYSDGEFFGTKDELKSYIEKNKSRKYKYKFNDAEGELGLHSIDSSGKKRIRFVLGNTIDKNKIKISSRAFSRISNIPDHIHIEELINEANKILNEYRKHTQDVFLTCFKGLRSDGKYRRRLDWNTCSWILNKAIEVIDKSNKYEDTDKNANCISFK